MERNLLVFNIEIWRSEMNLIDVELQEDFLSFVRESDLFGIIPKKCGNLRLNHDLSSLEKLNFATLCLEIWDLPTVCLLFF